MGVAENKAAVRHFVEEMNKGKASCMAALDESCATGFVSHAGNGRDIRGLMEVKQSYSELYNAFPDVHTTLDDMIGEGDKIVIRWTMTGTFTGKYRGIPPTNKKMISWFITIERTVGGKFVEEWGRSDALGYMQQLGLIPKTP